MSKATLFKIDQKVEGILISSTDEWISKMRQYLYGRLLPKHKKE